MIKKFRDDELKVLEYATAKMLIMGEETVARLIAAVHRKLIENQENAKYKHTEYGYKTDSEGIYRKFVGHDMGNNTSKSG